MDSVCCHNLQFFSISVKIFWHVLLEILMLQFQMCISLKIMAISLNRKFNVYLSFYAGIIRHQIRVIIVYHPYQNWTTVIMGCIGCAHTTVTTLLRPVHLNRYATSVSHFSSGYHLSRDFLGGRRGGGGRWFATVL